MCAWTADHAHASRTRGRRSKQSTGFRGRMHKSLTQTRPWEQNFATAFLSIAIATARSGTFTPLGHVMHSIFIRHTLLRVATPPSLYVRPEDGVVVLHVKQCLQTCCFVVFILVPYHTHIQSFSFITCSISQLWCTNMPLL